MSSAEATPGSVKAIPAAYMADSLAPHRDMANAIRALAMDAVQKANSGHPGLPMGAADVATVLFTKFLKFDASQPKWADRDRFVLSAGHGSMLLYALLHLTGAADMGIEDLKQFRQLHSKTAGHPEYGYAAGIETTTGPLGQGIATAVGMAMAERHMAARFGGDLVDHYTYALVGDGCLMEGISQEAIALAGHLRLARLIVLWDDNGITIDGSITLSDSTDQVKRFQASGWNALRVDGHDPAAIARAIRKAKASAKPTLIACKTIIGLGAPTKQGTAATHGAPLGADEIAGARKALGWHHAPFEIPEDVAKAWRKAGRRGQTERRGWEKRLVANDKRAAFESSVKGELPPEFRAAIDTYKQELGKAPPALATRNASQNALDVINPILVNTIGGSADLTGSNNTKSKGLQGFSAENYGGRYVSYGIREHGMAAAMNGMALHGGVIPYSGAFLVFSDYSRPAIRLGAIMHQRVIHVMTHDSIGLGEDGPTHQPVEHLAALRAIPNLLVLRPCDAVETVECWQIALESEKTPSILALTRQKLKPARLAYDAENLCARGAYEVSGAANATVAIFASGSEVEIAIAAQKLLAGDGIAARVVSVPCMELFETQDASYKARILGSETKRIAVEAAIRMGWDRFIGADGAFIGMTGFGASAPAEQLYKHFGITAEAVAAAAKN